MDNDLIRQKSWWRRHRIWLVPVCSGLLILVTIFFTSGMGIVASDFAQAYTDTDLYDKALKKAASDARVMTLLGDLQPIDNMAILEGQVEYSDDQETVTSSIQINGTKGKARMDIAADRNGNDWIYSKINIRFKTPAEKRQTIEIITLE